MPRSMHLYTQKSTRIWKVYLNHSKCTLSLDSFIWLSLVQPDTRLLAAGNKYFFVEISEMYTNDKNKRVHDSLELFHQTRKNHHRKPWVWVRKERESMRITRGLPTMRKLPDTVICRFATDFIICHFLKTFTYSISIIICFTLNKKWWVIINCLAFTCYSPSCNNEHSFLSPCNFTQFITKAY